MSKVLVGTAQQKKNGQLNGNSRMHFQAIYKQQYGYYIVHWLNKKRKEEKDCFLIFRSKYHIRFLPLPKYRFVIKFLAMHQRWLSTNSPTVMNGNTCAACVRKLSNDRTICELTIDIILIFVHYCALYPQYKCAQQS